MDRNKVPIFEPGIRSLVCPNCRSAETPTARGSPALSKLQGSIQITDGVLDLMPPSYRGYPGDSIEAAVLRDAHNREAFAKTPSTFVAR